MDTVIFTGRMPVAEFKRDKPAEYEALVAAGKLERAPGRALPAGRDPRRSAPSPGRRSPIGTLIVLWIVYAMVFAYR